MLTSLTGFAIIGVAIAVGYVLARTGVAGDTAVGVLTRIAFYALAPFLMFVVLTGSDIASLFSFLLPVSALAAAIVIVVYAVVARFAWKRRTGEIVIGAVASGQVNASNIGLPLAVYLLGSAAYPVPIILMQMVVFTPITLGLLDAVTSERRSVFRIVLRTFTTPIVVASGLGVFVSLLGVDLPPIMMEPIQLVADACVPVLLIAYGMSLHGQRVLGPTGRRRDIVLASALKVVVMPLLAWFFASVVFALTPQQTLILVVLAALPSPHNAFNYAHKYGVGEAIARDTVFLTTLGCVPVIFAAVLLLG